jgi:hypothetical protein
MTQVDAPKSLTPIEIDDCQDNSSEISVLDALNSITDTPGETVSSTYHA